MRSGENPAPWGGEVYCCGDAQRVIVGSIQFGGVFHQIDPDQQPAAGHRAAGGMNLPQEGQGLCGREIANA